MIHWLFPKPWKITRHLLSRVNVKRLARICFACLFQRNWVCYFKLQGKEFRGENGAISHEVNKAESLHQGNLLALLLQSGIALSKHTNSQLH